MATSPVQKDKRLGLFVYTGGHGRAFSATSSGRWAGPGGQRPILRWRKVYRARMIDVLVTGGAGFIGSNFFVHALAARHRLARDHSGQADYAGRLENLHDVMDTPRHTFVHGDICDAPGSGAARRHADIVVHFAAETHVDRSILAAGRIHQDGRHRNVRAARSGARRPKLQRFVQISTDEVYGSVPEGRAARPTNCGRVIRIRRARPAPIGSPTATWRHTTCPVIVTRASNNYGPYQFPEKVIPLFVTNAMDDIPVPLYGDGAQRP